MLIILLLSASSCYIGDSYYLLTFEMQFAVGAESQRAPDGRTAVRSLHADACQCHSHILVPHAITVCSQRQRQHVHALPSGPSNTFSAYVLCALTYSPIERLAAAKSLARPPNFTPTYVSIFHAYSDTIPSDTFQRLYLQLFCDKYDRKKYCNMGALMRRA
jgi:hypothetical protein